MKNKIKWSLVFAGGLLIGAISTFIILGQLSYLRYADFYPMSAREQVSIASELRLIEGGNCKIALKLIYQP